MSLPTELIDEFAKITFDENEKREDTSCYGTATFKAGVPYVLIDGATTPTPATFAVNAVEGDRVLVRIKNHKALVTANITSPSMTLSVLKVDTGLIIKGYLTTNEKRLRYDDTVNEGLTFSGGGIGAYGGVGKYWYVTNTGDLYASSADISGKITASTGFIGSVANGFRIDEYGIYSGTKAGVNDGYITLTNSDFQRQINNVNHADLRFAIAGKFGVSKDGTVYASGVDVSGKITATSGYIGSSTAGFNIDQYGIYSGVKTDNVSGYISLSNTGFERVLNGTKRTDLRFAIGSNFGVTGNGSLYSSSADISGKITAGSGKIGDFEIGSGIFSGGKNSIDSIKSGVYIGVDGIGLGANSPFKVTNEGYLYASNAEIVGDITARSLKVGYGDVNLYAEDDGILIREGEREIAKFGYDGQSFKNSYGKNVFELGYLQSSVYTKSEFYYYNNTSPFTIELNWDVDETATGTITVFFYTDLITRKDSLSYAVPYTRTGRIVEFPASSCEKLKTNSITYIEIQYRASGKFPYYTIGENIGGEAGRFSLRQGINCVASGNGSHSQGNACLAMGNNSHTEGERCKTATTGYAAHAEGSGTSVSAFFGHAEGEGSIVTGTGAHAEGFNTTAQGDYSHASGSHTVAASPYQTVIGKYNDVDSDSKYAFIIGVGDNGITENGLTVDWNGNLECNNIGAIVTASQSVAIATAGIDTYTTGPHVYLEPGVWVISGQWVFNTGDSSGARNLGVMLSPNSGTSGSGGYRLVRMASANQGWASMVVTDIISLDSATNVYLKAASSMTYSTATICTLKAVRLK